MGPRSHEVDSHLHDQPPAGCDPDAMKLFVGNISKTCTEDQLLPFFESIGKVRWCVRLVLMKYSE